MKDYEEITPEGSIVPVYLSPLTDEELTEIALNNQKVLAEEKRVQDEKLLRQSAFAKLEAIGLTVSEIESLGI